MPAIQGGMCACGFKRQGSRQPCRLRAPPACYGVLRLEHVLQCELKITLSLCVIDEAEGSADGGVRSYEDGVIEGVDGFCTELQALMLKGSKALGDAEVDRLQAGTSEASNLAVAEARRGLGNRTRIEPDITGAASNVRDLLWSLDGLPVAVGPGKA